jgi:hypothetical protein
MSRAWETTEEDLRLVLQRHFIAAGESTIEKANDLVNAQSERVEKAALVYDDMDDQTASAHDEIEKILIESGIIGGQKKQQA